MSPLADPSRRADGVRPPVDRLEAGFTLAELLAVVAVLGVLVYVSAAGWDRVRTRAETVAAARLVQSFLAQARVQAITRGVGQFVVIDGSDHSIEIRADTGSTADVLDANDERIARANLGAGGALQLPAGMSLVDPLTSSALTSAWSLPDPSGTEWGSTRHGLLVTPRGTLLSADASPAEINRGTIVLSDGRSRVAAVSIRDRRGSMRTYELVDGTWKER